MTDIATEVARVAAETGFSGAVRIERGTDLLHAQACGLADRRWEVANTLDTRFALASAAKGFTALTVLSLVQDGTLTLDTPVRSVLGTDLALIDDAVTIEHLLGHRSGIGDYLDEDDWEPDAYVLKVPVHQLDRAADYLPVIDGFPQVFSPDERFFYNNGGFVVLALVAERVTGLAFHELVDQRVCRPAGLTETAFLRSDELPGRTAVGYLHQAGLRSNVFHLPMRGCGDGGIYATLGDVSALWRAMMNGQIISPELVELATRPRSRAPEDPRRYGLGFWLHESGPGVSLEGMDAGVSFRSVHDPQAGTTWSVVSNTTDGAWPVARTVAALLG